MHRALLSPLSSLLSLFSSLSLSLPNASLLDIVIAHVCHTRSALSLSRTLVLLSSLSLLDLSSCLFYIAHLRDVDIFNPLSQVILVRRRTHRWGTCNTLFRLHSTYCRRSSLSYRISDRSIHRRVNGVTFVVPSDVVVYWTPYDHFVVGHCCCRQARHPSLVVELVVVILGPSRFSVPLSFGSGSSQTRTPTL